MLRVFLHRGVDIVDADNASPRAASETGLHRPVENCGSSVAPEWKMRFTSEACARGDRLVRSLRHSASLRGALGLPSRGRREAATITSTGRGAAWLAR